MGGVIMLLFWYELKKIIGKMRLFVLGCLGLNLLGVSPLWRLDHSIDRNVVSLGPLFGAYLPNLTLECAVIALLLTHFIIGYEYSNHTESTVYSTAIGRKCLHYKFAASVCGVFMYSIALFAVSLAAYFIRSKKNIYLPLPLFYKILAVSAGVILLFILFAFAVGAVIRNPWAAAITSISVNVAWVGVILNFLDDVLLRLPPMGLLASQKVWFTDVFGRNFELNGLILSGVCLVAMCVLTYKIFRRRDI
jgi:ABC-type transport system involved in multi-copper enzyme maturation permease subunit